VATNSRRGWLGEGAEAAVKSYRVGAHPAARAAAAAPFASIQPSRFAALLPVTFRGVWFAASPQQVFVPPAGPYFVPVLFLGGFRGCRNTPFDSFKTAGVGRNEFAVRTSEPLHPSTGPLILLGSAPRPLCGRDT